MLFERKVKELYRRNLFSRADRARDVRFLTSADFDGLREVPYNFKTVKGDKLVGSFYYYPNPKEKRIVVFDHGMGQGGHRAYMREIETLCKNGYLVYSYDHTGCCDSGGESTGGFSQSLCDLDSCFAALKADAQFKGYGISVVGHSWGAYSALNIGAYHPDVKHIVAMSGFISVREMHKQLFSGVASFLRKTVFELEAESNPDYVESSAIDALKKTDAALLVIHSADDNVVSAKRHFEQLKYELRGRENTEFILLNGRAHNPNYTDGAVAYLAEFFKDLTGKRKRGELETDEACEKFIAGYDFFRMTEQDSAVWERIFTTLA